MKDEYKKIYPYFIKRKIIGFLLFFALAIIVYFISIFYKNIPIIISFILIYLLYAIRISSNFIYASYLYKFSNLKDSDIETEAKGFYFLGILSFPIILITGFLMNMLLQSPNYAAGFVQIFLLFSFFILLNEFFIIYSISKIQKLTLKKDYTKIKEQNPISFVIMMIIENVGAIFFLIALALRLDFPINFISLFFLFIMIIVTVYLFYRIFRKSNL
ncbi:hypothetical protein J4221_03955 [Candidatus Pacearchaeota archaeon]|nr:hypothetical protein [Candidatus Pacearchaeota archaeon]